MDSPSTADRAGALRAPAEDPPGRVRGADHDLPALLSAHLFVLSPNNSGSTFLAKTFRTSQHTWNLRTEGHKMAGFIGPRPGPHRRQLLWAARPSWIRAYRDPAGFDWAATRGAWYRQAWALQSGAQVLVEKSPPFLLIPDQLVAHFPSTRFVIMVRNPYATFEGIIRRRRRPRPGTTTDPRILAARHIVACMREQSANRRRHHGISTFFTYEQLCGDPDLAAKQVMALVPQVEDLDLRVRVRVKGTYDEPLRDMNRDHLARLAPEDRMVAHRVFARHPELFADFGYDVA